MREGTRRELVIGRWMQRVWYERAAGGFVLIPLSWLFRALVALRRALYRAGLFRSHAVGRPVIVIGNLTVGGTGKTPLTLWLAQQLHARGLQVGVAMRGYGSERTEPRLASVASTPQEVGDEPALIARREVATVAVGHDRVAVARLLVESGCDVILADDGLQHLRLARDAEIVVIDGARGFGNGRLLPAGPLREPVERCDAADVRVVNGAGSPVSDAVRMSLRMGEARSLAGGAGRPVSSFAATRVHAVAGIGHPARFFAALREQGLDPIEHPLPDHAVLRRQDVTFEDALPVLMTEKDAVKCAPFADGRHWYVPVTAAFDAGDEARLMGAIEARLRAHAARARGAAPKG